MNAHFRDWCAFLSGDGSASSIGRTQTELLINRQKVSVDDLLFAAVDVRIDEGQPLAVIS